jgi:hypothetical protein
MAKHSLPEDGFDEEPAPTCGLCPATDHTDLWHDEYWPDGDDL